jgi:hypothetical protein
VSFRSWYKLIIDVPSECFEAIWAQITDVLSGILLADGGNATTEQLEEDESFILPMLERLKLAIIPRLGDVRVPDQMRAQLSEILRKASVLYHYDVRSQGGTTAPVIAEAQERLRYWAFDLLIAVTSRGKEGEGAKMVAKGTVEALMRRFEDAIKGFLEDARLRGQTPFSR